MQSSDVNTQQTQEEEKDLQDGWITYGHPVRGECRKFKVENGLFYLKEKGKFIIPVEKLTKLLTGKDFNVQGEENTEYKYVFDDDENPMHQHCKVYYAYIIGTSSGEGEHAIQLRNDGGDNPKAYLVAWARFTDAQAEFILGHLQGTSTPS